MGILHDLQPHEAHEQQKKHEQHEAREHGEPQAELVDLLPQVAQFDVAGGHEWIRQIWSGSDRGMRGMRINAQSGAHSTAPSSAGRK